MKCDQCQKDFDACDLSLYNSFKEDGNPDDSLYLCEKCYKFLSEQTGDGGYFELVEPVCSKIIKVVQIGFNCPRCGGTHFWDISIKDPPFQDYLPPQSSGFMVADCGAQYSLDIQIAKMAQLIHIKREDKK